MEAFTNAIKLKYKYMKREFNKILQQSRDA